MLLLIHIEDLLLFFSSKNLTNLRVVQCLNVAAFEEYESSF